jgi:hypothetical protein
MYLTRLHDLLTYHEKILYSILANPFKEKQLEIELKDNEAVDEKGKKKKKKWGKKDKDDKEKEKEKSVPMSRVFALNKPEWHYILIGCFFAIVSGAVQPAFSIILSKAVGVSVIYLKLNIYDLV